MLTFGLVNTSIMKQILPLFLLATTAFTANAQTQIGNGGMETWETVTGSSVEPTNWNSFLTAGGSVSWAASDQVSKSTDMHSGSFSCRINSKSTLGIIANGNITVGKINMGNASPTNSSNYNATVPGDANFSEAFTDHPDSLVFWAKFVPASGNNTDSARVAAFLHDDYAFQDGAGGSPYAASEPHMVAKAIRNFPNTSNTWVRVSVPFDYSGSATSTQYLLVTFTTNKTPGGGSNNDYLYIDDVSLIYNSTGLGIEETTLSGIHFGFADGKLTTFNGEGIEGTIKVYANSGQMVMSGAVQPSYDLSFQKGVYFVVFEGSNGLLNQKVINY